jgi:hypothetical protein
MLRVRRPGINLLPTVKSTVRRPCRAQAPEGAQSILHAVVWLQPLQPLQLAALQTETRAAAGLIKPTTRINRLRLPCCIVKGRSGKGGKRHKGSQKQTTQTQTKRKPGHAPSSELGRLPMPARRCSAAPHVCTPEQTRIAAYTRTRHAAPGRAPSLHCKSSAFTIDVARVRS